MVDIRFPEQVDSFLIWLTPFLKKGWEKVAGLKFQLGSYRDADGQFRPCYQLTKIQCLYIADELEGRDLVRLRTRVSCVGLLQKNETFFTKRDCFERKSRIFVAAKE